MKTIFADYNAITEAGHLCLTTRGSQEAIARAGARPGDWAWFSDGEVVVGAQLAIDDRYGLVGEPDWDTLVHLDDEDAADIESRKDELTQLMRKEPTSIEDEPRVLQLLVQVELLAPADSETLPGLFAFRRALALRSMDSPGLALVEATEAYRARPNDAEVAFFYLELLGRQDLPSAVDEAERIAASPEVPALVLSACINILAAHAEQVSDRELGTIAERVFALCRRFDRSSDLDQAGDSLRALSYVNRGMVLLRGGRTSEARQAFEVAQTIYPTAPLIDQLARLQGFDERASEIARKWRTIAEDWVPHGEVAA